MGDAATQLRTLADESVNCCVTSPPYWGLRDYGVAGQLGLEDTVAIYLDRMTEVFREVRRVLRKDGTLWMNIGDSYLRQQGRGFNGNKRLSEADRSIKTKRPNFLKEKELLGMPWRLAFALSADGWYLRSDIIWNKPNCIPESCKDRPTRSHEYLFLLTKSPRYYYDIDATREPHKQVSKERILRKRGRQYKYLKAESAETQTIDADLRKACHPNGKNKRTVWSVPAKGFKGAHFATFPEKLIRPCIAAGCPVGGTVIDPFFGAGTTAVVAIKTGRKCIGIELNPEYIEIAKRRLSGVQLEAQI